MLYATKGQVPGEDYVIPLGRAEVKREGKDVSFIGIHTMVLRGLSAADRLAAEGISVEVIDPRTLNPLDIDTIVASVKKTGRVVIAHEAYSRGGVAGEIAMQIVENAFDYLDAPIVRVAGRNVPIPYNLKLERAAVPQEEDVVSALRNIVAK
jgi:pyruvate dehydrogenase E1 component beta subunit